MIDLDRPLAGALVVGLAAFLVYAPSLDGGFVYDDGMLLVHNEHVHRLEDPGRFFSDPGTLSDAGALHSYRPLRSLLFAVEWRLFGDSPLGYRIVSAILHALVAMTVLALLRRWTGLPRGALFGALLFAAHPVATECVPWVSIQGDLVSAGAMLAALWVLERPGVRNVVVALALFLLAVGTKESAVALPALVLVRVLWLPKEERTRERWIGFAAILVAAILYAVLRQVMVTGVAAEASAHRGWYGGSWGRSVAAFLAGLVYYAGTLLLPVELTVRWSPLTPPPALLLGLGALILAAIAIAAIRWRGRHPWPTAGFLMAALVLGPASSVLIPLPTITEIRYLYPVLPFVLLALVPFLARRRAWTVGAVVVLMAMLSVRRAQEWDSDDTLWNAAVDRPRSTPEALLNVAFRHLRNAAEARRLGSTDELDHLLDARTRMLAYADERRPYRDRMHAHERGRLVDGLAEIADRLLVHERKAEAVVPALAAVHFGGPEPRLLRLLIRAFESVGRHRDAIPVRRDLERIERGR